MSTTNILDLNNRIDALEKIAHDVEPIQQQIDELKAWTNPGTKKDASGNPITLTDGSARNAEGLAVTCNPKQNLHGYDKPWAGGAGKNKLPMTVDGIKEVNIAGTWSGNVYSFNSVTFTIQTDADGNVTGIKVNGTASATIKFNCPTIILSSGSYNLSGTPTGGSDSTFRTLAYNHASSSYVAYDAGEGYNFTLNNDGDISTFISITTGTEITNKIFSLMIRKSTESATFAPYSNECPITGYTECMVDRDGKNLFDGIFVQGYYNVDGSMASINTRLSSNKISIPPAERLTLSLPNGFYAYRFCFWDVEQNFIRSYDNADVTVSKVLTIPTNARYLGFTARNNNGTDITPESITQVQLEQCSTATPYVPYSHDNATITFGQTVYGVSVDFKTGKVTVTHASIASYNGETINEPWISSIDEYVSGTTPTTGAQVVYPLATPTELTLTAAELELLKGYNYITTNGTNIELTYMPDTLKADILLTVSQLYGSKIAIFDGILTGGDTGQVLTKTSNDNYDATWAALPATRTTTKKSEK